MRHKETFQQPAHDGLSPHVVVQYWDEKGALHASYFGNWEDAKEFEDQLAKRNTD